MGRGAWQATVHGVAKESGTTKDADMCIHTPLLFLCSPMQNAMRNPCPSLNQFSRVQFFATLRTVALQAPLSKGFTSQEYWSG